MSAARELTAEDRQAASAVTFDLERFEWTAGDRLEVAGRWFGIRGRRFLRPTLDIEVDGQPRRMLAVLEHKPWAAEEGSEWMAAFTWRHEPIDPAEAELAVAQDLTVQLPAPSTAPGASRKRERGRRQDRRSGQRAAGPPRAELLERERAARVEAQRLRVELEQARATHAEAARELRERVAAEEAAKTGTRRAARACEGGSGGGGEDGGRSPRRGRGGRGCARLGRRGSG